MRKASWVWRRGSRCGRQWVADSAASSSLLMLLGPVGAVKKSCLIFVFYFLLDFDVFHCGARWNGVATY